MTDTERRFGTYFGEPWPSGVCDEPAVQVPTPVGEDCELCGAVRRGAPSGNLGGLDIGRPRPHAS